MSTNVYGWMHVRAEGIIKKALLLFRIGKQSVVVCCYHEAKINALVSV